uniref:Uncharacterized protein n=1 Tax=Trypanosoma vivax (strain Y486) TaxID=1055687 RepID=G0U3C8_TRYVY|nr:hypothetical protein, unlikely [Trypanosoma vivax Y486]
MSHHLHAISSGAGSVPPRGRGRRGHVNILLYVYLFLTFYSFLYLLLTFVLCLIFGLSCTLLFARVEVFCVVAPFFKLCYYCFLRLPMLMPSFANFLFFVCYYYLVIRILEKS